MWFRNLQLFRLTPAWAYSTDELNAALRRGSLLPCGKLDRRSSGWVEPRGEPGEMVFSVGKQQLITLGFWEKLLPASIIRQHAETKCAEIEAAQGYKPGRKQAREIREQVEANLLPRAFAHLRQTYVWIDPVNRWLAVDAASPARADEVVEALKLALGELPLALLKTCASPGPAMTCWLLAGDVDGPFSIDRDSELRAVEDRATVRYLRHNLDSDPVREHIQEGKLVTRLALTWNDRLSFILSDNLQVKRLAFLDLIKEDAERQAETGDDLFSANFGLMCGELAAMLRGLVAALGGEGE